MPASSAKEKTGEHSKYASSSKPFPSDKNTTASSSRLTDTVSSGAGNKSLVSVPNTQNNTFKVRKDMPYMFPGSTPTTTDIPIFREEFLEHNKVIIFNKEYLQYFRAGHWKGDFLIKATQDTCM